MKRIIAFLVCLTLLFSMTSSVFAVFETSSGALTASATQLKRGDTFTVTATLTNPDAIGMGSVALLYDSAVFEMVSGNCLVQAPAGLMLFPVVLPEEGVGSFTFFAMAGDSTAVVTGDLFSFEMKVKDDAPFGTYEIGNETSIGVDTITVLNNSTGVTVTVVCEHVMSDNWVQDDAQNHKKDCTVPGCEYKDTEAHSFGNWVKADGSNHKRTCSVATCGYVETRAHNFDQQVIANEYKADNASCTNKATYYYSCSCGAKGTTTFETGDMLPHTYDQEKVEDAYKVSGATCTKKAVYNHSCVCGAKGTTTFETGSLLAHVYNQQVAEERYEVTPATCTTQATYHYSCSCGAEGTETFAAGALKPHTYDQEKVEDAYKVSGATCTKKAVYNHSCVCGAKGTTTFETGSLLPHVYNQQVAEEQYKATAATCIAKATYYKSCSCGAKGTETFAAGEFAAHSFETWTKVDENNHESICSVTGCQEKKTEAHSYSEQLTAGEDTHWNACVCGEKKNEAAHAYGEEWKSDTENHWQVCACGAKSEAVKHDWDDGKVTEEATTEKVGEKTFTCKDCGETKTEELPKVEPPKQEETPDTGDEFLILPLILLALVSAFGVVVGLLLKRRKDF